LNLAFEFQGDQHYKRVYGLNKSNLERTQMRDKEKKQKCKEKGITLVVIPFWWDRGIASLTTIHQTKQGLVDDVPIGASPIHENCPQGFKKHSKEMNQNEGKFNSYFLNIW
jgi:hypothetical protein